MSCTCFKWPQLTSITIARNIYIRTAYAWYVLHTPSPQYAPFWTEFSIKERIFFELITTVVEDRSLKYEEFEKHIQEQDDADRPITAEDLRDESVVRAPLCLILLIELIQRSANTSGMPGASCSASVSRGTP